MPIDNHRRELGGGAGIRRDVRGSSSNSGQSDTGGGGGRSSVVSGTTTSDTQSAARAALRHRAKQWMNSQHNNSSSSSSYRDRTSSNNTISNNHNHPRTTTTTASSSTSSVSEASSSTGSNTNENKEPNNSQSHNLNASSITNSGASSSQATSSIKLRWKQHQREQQQRLQQQQQQQQQQRTTSLSDPPLEESCSHTNHYQSLRSRATSRSKQRRPDTQPSNEEEQDVGNDDGGGVETSLSSWDVAAAAGPNPSSSYAKSPSRAGSSTSSSYIHYGRSASNRALQRKQQQQNQQRPPSSQPEMVLRIREDDDVEDYGMQRNHEEEPRHHHKFQEHGGKPQIQLTKTMSTAASSSVASDALSSSHAGGITARFLKSGPTARGPKTTSKPQSSSGSHTSSTAATSTTRSHSTNYTVDPTAPAITPTTMASSSVDHTAKVVDAASASSSVTTGGDKHLKTTSLGSSAKKFESTKRDEHDVEGGTKKSASTTTNSRVSALAKKFGATTTTTRPSTAPPTRRRASPSPWRRGRQPQPRGSTEDKHPNTTTTTTMMDHPNDQRQVEDPGAWPGTLGSTSTAINGPSRRRRSPVRLASRALDDKFDVDSFLDEQSAYSPERPSHEEDVDHKEEDDRQDDKLKPLTTSEVHKPTMNKPSFLKKLHATSSSAKKPLSSFRKYTTTPSSAAKHNKTAAAAPTPTTTTTLTEKERPSSSAAQVSTNHDMEQTHSNHEAAKPTITENMEPKDKPNRSAAVGKPRNRIRDVSPFQRRLEEFGETLRQKNKTHSTTMIKPTTTTTRVNDNEDAIPTKQPQAPSLTIQTMFPATSKLARQQLQEQDDDRDSGLDSYDGPNVLRVPTYSDVSPVGSSISALATPRPKEQPLQPNKSSLSMGPAARNLLPQPKFDEDEDDHLYHDNDDNYNQDHHHRRSYEEDDEDYRHAFHVTTHNESSHENAVSSSLDHSNGRTDLPGGIDLSFSEERIRSAGKSVEKYNSGRSPTPHLVHPGTLSSRRTPSPFLVEKDDYGPAPSTVSSTYSSSLARHASAIASRQGTSARRPRSPHLEPRPSSPSVEYYKQEQQRQQSRYHDTNNDDNTTHDDNDNNVVPRLSAGVLAQRDFEQPAPRLVNGMTVQGFTGFFDKTSDLPNLADEVSVSTVGTQHTQGRGAASSPTQPYDRMSEVVEEEDDNNEEEEDPSFCNDDNSSRGAEYGSVPDVNDFEFGDEEHDNDDPSLNNDDEEDDDESDVFDGVLGSEDVDAPWPSASVSNRCSTAQQVSQVGGNEGRGSRPSQRPPSQGRDVPPTSKSTSSSSFVTADDLRFFDDDNHHPSSSTGTATNTSSTTEWESFDAQGFPIDGSPPQEDSFASSSLFGSPGLNTPSTSSQPNDTSMESSFGTPGLNRHLFVDSKETTRKSSALTRTAQLFDAQASSRARSEASSATGMSSSTPFRKVSVSAARKLFETNKSTTSTTPSYSSTATTAIRTNHTTTRPRTVASSWVTSNSHKGEEDAFDKEDAFRRGQEEQNEVNNQNTLEEQQQPQEPLYNDDDVDEHEFVDLEHYYIPPDVARLLVRRFRTVCDDLYAQAEYFDNIEKMEECDDAKKAFALSEMRSRIMEQELETTARSGETFVEDDLVLTPTYLSALRVRDASVVSRSWRDGATPQDVWTAHLLGRRSTHVHYIKRPLYSSDGEYDPSFVGSNQIEGVTFYWEEVSWMDDLVLEHVKSGTGNGRMPGTTRHDLSFGGDPLWQTSKRGLSNLFTLGDCQSMLLKLTNEYLVTSEDELADAIEYREECYERLEDQQLHASTFDPHVLDELQDNYQCSIKDVEYYQVKRNAAVRALASVKQCISKMISRYETMLVKINEEEEEEEDESCVEDDDTKQPPLMTQRNDQPFTRSTPLHRDTNDDHVPARRHEEEAEEEQKRKMEEERQRQAAAAAAAADAERQRLEQRAREAEERAIQAAREVLEAKEAAERAAQEKEQQLQELQAKLARMEEESLRRVEEARSEVSVYKQQVQELQQQSALAKSSYSSAGGGGSGCSPTTLSPLEADTARSVLSQKSSSPNELRKIQSIKARFRQQRIMREQQQVDRRTPSPSFANSSSQGGALYTPVTPASRHGGVVPRGRCTSGRTSPMTPSQNTPNSIRRSPSPSMRKRREEEMFHQLDFYERSLQSIIQ